jgi:hypothetical protein
MWSEPSYNRDGLRQLYSFKSAQFESPAVKEDFMCDIWSVKFSENVIVPVLKSVTRKRLVETVME